MLYCRFGSKDSILWHNLADVRQEIVNFSIMKAKTILITGATSGIGEACARRFAGEGRRLILNGRNTEKLAALRRELVARGSEVQTLPFDVRDREAMSRAMASLPEGWDNIDVLVNNAGLSLGDDKEYEGSLEEWDTVIDTNIKALLAMTRMVVPGMVERGHGGALHPLLRLCRHRLGGGSRSLRARRSRGRLQHTRHLI